MNAKLVVVVRWIMGVQFLLNGLNWWVKIFPFPNAFDAPGGFMKHDVVGAMIDTGWMFGLAKVIEIVTGLALVFNRYIPLMLVVSMPVVLSTFLLDSFFLDEIVGWLAGDVAPGVAGSAFLDWIFWGGSVMAMQVYMMLAYFHYYQPMLVRKPEHLPGRPVDFTPAAPGVIESCRVIRRCYSVLGVIALITGTISTLWLILMINQWLVPWSSLRIIAH